MSKSYNFIAFLLILGMGGLGRAAEFKFFKEKQLFYTDLKDGQTTWLQAATEIIPVAQAAQIPGFADLYHVAKNKEGIRSFALVRSSFYLPLSGEEIRRRLGNPVALSQNSKRMKVTSCVQSDCTGRIQAGLASVDIRLRYGIINQEQATGSWQSVFTDLHQPDFISTQEFLSIERVFARGGSYSAFYQVGEKLTWVQSYQIFAIKESAYAKAALIPFFNLEKSLRGTIYDLVLDGRQSLLQEKPGAQRRPASSIKDSDLYMQENYKLSDPVGDEALIRRASRVPKRILRTLLGEEELISQTDPWLPEPWELVDPLAKKGVVPEKLPEPHIQGREKPIHLERFTEMLDQVLWEESQRGLAPIVGDFHEWAPETLEKYREKSAVVGFSKLFISLSLGFTNRFMKTGQEKSLWQWIMTKDYNSITFPDLFRASYRLHRGNVYLTLLAIENLLAANWRYPERESLPATRRLRPITSGFNYEQDKFGTWYHFFGMILYGYKTGSGFKSNFVGRMEALGSNILSSGVNKRQKQWFNKLGGYVGEDLRESVMEKRYLYRIPNSLVLGEDYYLNRTEDFRDRLPLISSQDIAIEVKKSFDETVDITLQNLGSDTLEDCVVDVIKDAGGGYYAPFKHRYYGKSLPVHGKLEINLPAPMPRGVRVFVDQCVQGTPRAMEWSNYSL